jgi:cytochrome P450
VFSWILEAFNNGPKTLQDRYNLHGDSQLIVIAGSDSSAAALTHIFFRLAWNPEVTAALQKEFDAIPSLEYEELVKIPLLDAVIQETLRLNPPVPSGTQRVTPPEGLQIGDHYIPGNVIVQVPNYTVCRGKSLFLTWHNPANSRLDPRYFVRPLEFIPERWMTRPDLIIDKSVYIPFNAGNYFQPIP